MDPPKNRSKSSNTVLEKDLREYKPRIQGPKEELRAGTRKREAGQIGFNKQVRTDHEQLRVPTRNEEVSVERVPVERGRDALRPRSARTGSLAGIA
jgi:stress response protein YsnF